LPLLRGSKKIRAVERERSVSRHLGEENGLKWRLETTQESLSDESRGQRRDLDR